MKHRATISLFFMVAFDILCTSNAMEASEEKRPALTDTQFVGTWRLVSIYQENESGYEIDQFAGAANGLLMADADGNFSLEIMNNRTRRLLSNLPPALVMMRRDGLAEAVVYFGRYAIDKSKRKVTLHIDRCLFRGCDQTARKADLAFDGNTMTMISAVEASLTGASYSYSQWRRLNKKRKERAPAR